MESEKVKEIKELLRCMNGEKACTNCYINDIAQEQETCCINVVADMTLDIINELEKALEKEQINNLNCDTDLQYKEKRIAELEKEIEENAFYSKGYAQGIKNTYDVVVPDKLKQFAGRLKEKVYDIFGDKVIWYDDIDETLKEFIIEK